MRYNHLDMLPEKAFSPVGKRMTLEGGGGGGQTQTSQTGIDPMLKPYISYGLTEAQNLYKGNTPQYYGGQMYVSPSQATQQALQANTNRALTGNPLLTSAQANLGNLQTATNVANPMYANIYNNAQTSPNLANAVYGGMATGALRNQATPQYQNLYGSANTTPSLSGDVYSNLAAGNITNAANPYNQATASGSYLNSNPYFNQALGGAAQAAQTNYYDAIKQAQGGAAQAGRYGSNVSADLQNRAATTLANTLANKYGELAFQNYGNERGLQEAAMGRLGSLSQSDIANQLAGATNLAQAGQNTFANQLAATQGLANVSQQNLANQMAGAQALTGVGQQQLANQLQAAGGLASTSAADLSRQLAAGQAAPTLAAADYNDINQLLKSGQAMEEYQQKALDADINKFNYQQNLPYSKLSTYLGSVYGAPQGSVTQSTTSGGKIVCTAMNEAYGFGSFRQAIWLKHSASMPNAKTVEKGYHTLFLPVVAYAFNGNPNVVRNAVRSVAEHIARHRTADLWKEMRGKKRDPLGRIYRAVIEPLCFVVGKVKGC